MVAQKLAAIVRSNTGDARFEPCAFPAGAALVRPDGLWVLVDKPGPGVVGGAIVLAQRIQAPTLSIFFDNASDALVAARLLQPFAIDATACWLSELTAIAVVAEEPPIVERFVLTDTHRAAFASEITSCTADAVPTDTSLVAEVLGLEVGRVVIDPEEMQARIEVGVGHNDREARVQQGPWFDVALGGQPRSLQLDATVDSQRLELVDLARTVDHIRSVRHKGAHPQPATLLARAGWMRHEACANPASIGFDSLRPIRPGPERGLNHDYVAFALGTKAEADWLVSFICAAVLDSVPLAATVRTESFGPLDWCVVVVDDLDLSLIDQLVGAARPKPAITTMSAPW
jgi:hypothetical protein